MGWLTYTILVVAFVVAFIIYLSENTYRKPDFSDFLEAFVVSVGSTLLVSLCLTLILMFSVPQTRNCTAVVTEFTEYNIVSAAQTDKLEGRRYLCGGWLEEKPVYKAYKVNDDGSLIMVSMYASTTKIIETDEVKPHIKEYLKGEYRDIKWGWWRKAVFGGTEGKAYKNFISTDLVHTGIIYIPKGTIKPTFDGMNF